jgi:toxin-antitoxin system PIN domain toxin
VNDSACLYDANIWVALTFAAHPHHTQALAHFATRTPASPVCFCRATQQSFLRLVSTPSILEAYGAAGLTNADALRTLAAWMALPQVRHEEEPDGLEPRWHRLAGVKTASPKLWMDAYLAAFALTRNIELVTLDQAFRKFEPHALRLRLIGSLKS